MNETMKRLKSLKESIKPNTYRTIKGQIASGNIAQALVGIERLESKMKRGL